MINSSKLVLETKRGPTKYLNEFLWCCLTCLVTILIFFIVFSAWKIDWNYPAFGAVDDATGALFTLKSQLQGNSFYACPPIEAPFGSQFMSQLQDYVFPAGITGFLSLFIKNVGFLYNFYYFLTYILTSLVAYIALRLLKISPALAMLGGVLFSFVPYHYLRGAHYWLTSLYSLPLVCIAALWLINGELFSSEKNTRLGFKSLLSGLKTKKMLIAIVGCAIVGCTSLYYAFFALALLCFCGLCVCINRKEPRQLIYTAILCASVLLALFVALLPAFSRVLTYGKQPTIYDGRALSELFTYSLPLVMMFLPIFGHRINLFENITQEYYTQANIGTEVISVHLGFVMAIGLALSLCCVFFVKKNSYKSPLLLHIGKINLFLILLGMFYGFNVFIGMFISSSIRCYNRVSIFIAFFSMVLVALLLQNLFDYIRNKFKRRKWVVKSLSAFIAVGILTFGILDQTNNYFAVYSTLTPKGSATEYTDAYSDLTSKFKSMDIFVQAVEASVGDNKNIMICPSVKLSNGAYVNTLSFNPYVFSKNSNWSVFVNSNYGEWMYALQNTSPENIVEMSARLGFSGVLLSKKDLSEERFDDLQRELLTLDSTPIIDDNLGWYFFNIRKSKHFSENNLSPSEWESKKEALFNLLDNAVDFVSLDSLLLVGESSGAQPVEGSLSIRPQQLQYGPYIDLEKGEYRISVEGKNLDNASFSASADNGKQQLAISNLQISSNTVSYEVNLEEDAADVEFLIKNKGTSNAKITEYRYQKKENGVFEDYSEAGLNDTLSKIVSSELPIGGNK